MSAVVSCSRRPGVAQVTVPLALCAASADVTTIIRGHDHHRGGVDTGGRQREFRVGVGRTG